MTQDEKDLLLQDLCARLPYGVKVDVINEDNEHHIIEIGEGNIGHLGKGFWKECKPYLFPLSSMTNEQKNSFPFSYSFLEALIDGGVYFDEDECITLNDMIYVIQWCYKNHFDIYGLIPMGLAIDATNLNIY